MGRSGEEAGGVLAAYGRWLVQSGRDIERPTAETRNAETPKMVNTYTCAAFVHEVYRLAGVERLAELPNGYGIDYVPGMVDAADHAGFLRLKNPRNVMAGDMMTVRSDSSSSGLHAVLALAVTDKGIEVASEPGSSGRPEIKMYDWEALERAEKGHGQFYSAHRAPPQLVTSEAPPLVTETPPAGPVEDPALTETNSEPSPRLASVMGGPPPPTKRDFEQWEERDGGPGPLGPLLGESDPPRELSDGSLPGTPGVSPRLQQALHLQPPLSAPAPPPQPSPSPPLAEPDLPPPAAISPAGEPQELTPEVSSRLSEALGMPNSVSPALEPARRSRATAKDMLSGERTFAEFLQDQAAELASSVIGPPLHMVGRKPSEGLRLASAAYLSKRPVTASDLDESTLFLKPGSEMVELKFRNPFQPAEKGKGYLIPAIGGGGYGLENPLGSLDFDLSEEGEDAVDLLDLAVIPTPMKHVKTMSKIMAGERKQAVIGQFPPDSPAGKRFGAGETVGGPVRAELPLDVAQHGIEDMSVARGKAKVTPKSPRKKLVEPYMLKQDVPIYHETSAGEFRQFTEVPITDVLKSKSGGPPYPLGTQGTDMVFDRGLVFTDTPPTRGSGFIEKLQRRPGGGIVRRQVLRKGTPVLDTTNIQRGELPMAVDSVILGMEELGEMALTNKVAISAARRKILGALENNHDIVVKSGKLRFDSDDLTSLGHPSDIALRGTKRVPWDLLAKPDDWRDVDHVMAEMGRVWGSYSGFPVHKRESLFDPAFFGGKAGGHEYVVSDYDVLNDPRKLGPQVDNLFDFYEKRISEAPPSGFTSNARVWMQSGGNRHSIHSDNLRRVFEDIQDLDVDVPLWHVTTADAKVGQMGLRSATQLNQQKVLAVHAAHDRALKATDADFADPLDALDFVDKTDFGSVDKLADADYVDRLVKKARPAGLGGSPGMVSVTFLEDHAGMIEERLRYAALAARGDLDIDESMSLAGQWLEDAARDLGGDLNTMEMFAAITNRTYCMSDRTFRMYEDVLEGIEDPPPGFITRMKAIRVAARDAGLPEPTLPELIGDTDLNLLSRIMEGPQGVRPFGVIQNADWVAAGTADINRHLADSFTSPGGVVMTGTESSYAKLRPEEITTYRVAVRYGAESWKAIYNEAEIRFDPNDVWLLSR